MAFAPGLGYSRGQGGMIQMTFQTPFSVKEQVIVDKSGREVRLWGVNYYAPFNHSYAGLKAKGVSVRRAIDRDIEDFQRMGVQLVRMHLFARELTDAEGRLIDNEHLELLDYLIERLYQAGIYVMITAMAWWNSTSLQAGLRAGYAHVTLADVDGMGFASFCPKHMLIWHPHVLEAQERYLRQLFAHRNAFSGKTMPEYEHIALVEALNEPEYPGAGLMRSLEEHREACLKNPIRRRELELLGMYAEYLKERAIPDTDDERERFCADLVGRYIERMFAVVEEFFGGRALKAHIYYGFDRPHFREMLKNARRIDVLSLAFYSDLGRYYTPNERIIPEQLLGEDKACAQYVCGDVRGLGKPLVSYEWAITCTLTGFDHVAAARVMASLGVQCAAYFTYTPRDLGDYNPGWVMQYMNLYHTPRRAVGFAAAGAVFRQTPRDLPLPEGEVSWREAGYALDARTDFCAAQEGDTLYWAGEGEFAVQGEVSRVLAQGTCPFAVREGNGAYLLERQEDGRWLLTVLPDQFYVNDPYRGRNLCGSAFMNRDVDVNAVPVVSRLREEGSLTRLTIPGLETCRVERLEDGTWVPVDAPGGVFRADPGRLSLHALASAEAARICRP